MIVAQILHKICQAIIHKLLAIYIFQLTYLHRLVFHKCFSYNLDLMCINRFFNRFTNQVGVVAPEVIKDNWDRCLPCFDLKLKITGIVSRPLKLTCNMAVVLDLVVDSKFFFTYPTGICFGKFFLVFPSLNSVMLNS